MPFVRIVASVILVALVSLGPAAGQNGTPAFVAPANLSELVAAAAKEGTLNIALGASFGGPEGARIVQDHLDKKYHINLAIHYSPVSGGVTFINQLIQEIRAGQPASSDVMFNAPNFMVTPYVRQIDWRRYVPGLPLDAMLYDKHAVKVLSALNAFDYNTKLVAPNQVPKSFADLLKPQWKGKIATSPYLGTFISYIGLPSVLGHQGMLDFINKFTAQVSGIMVCGEMDRVVAGEFAIFGLDCGDHEARLRERKGEPIGTIYPQEGTPLDYVSPAIPTTSVHPNAATLFVAFLLTREGQDVMWDLVGEDNDLLPGSHMAKVIADLRRHGVKIIEGIQGTGLDVQHPELLRYAREVDAIVNQGK
jgi:ABC-type thiamine transport system substrate-binding protein